MAYIYQTRSKSFGKNKNYSSHYVVFKDYDGRYAISHKVKNKRTGSTTTAGYLGSYKSKTAAINQARYLQRNFSLK